MTSKHLWQLINHNLVHVSVASAAVLMVVVGIVLSWQTARSYQDTAEMKRGVAAADALLAAADIQARERGLGALLLADPDNDWGRRQLTETRAAARQRWRQAFNRIEQVAVERREGGLDIHIHQLKKLHQEVRSAREQLDRFLAGTADKPPLRDWLGAANDLNETAARVHDEIVLGIRLPPRLAYANLAVKRAIWVASEHAGQNRAILSHFAAAGLPVHSELTTVLNTNRAMAENAMQQVLQMHESPYLDSRLTPPLEQMAMAYDSRCRPACATMLAAADSGDYPRNGRQWFETATGCINNMLSVSRAASLINQQRLESWTEQHLLLFGGYVLFAAMAALLALFSLGRVHRNAREVFRQKELAEVTLGSIGDAVITTDTEGRIEYINPVAQELTGWSAEASRGRPFRDVFRLYNRTHASMTDPVGTCLAEGTVVGLTSGHVLIRHDGKEIPIEDSAAPIRDRDGSVVGAVVVFYDTRKTAEHHLVSYHATRDALTGLINRREFEYRLEELLARAQATCEIHALAYIDLDQFKLVNDSCGHTAGDRMLRQIAFLLQKRVRTSDTLARLGGDEFGLLLSNCTMEQALQVAEELRRTAQDFRFAWEGQVFQTGVSIGLVPITAESVNVAELLSEVDAACYAAKEKGRNRIQVFHPNDLELAQRQGDMLWLPRLREAMEQQRLVLYCQPLSTLRTGLPDYVEITIRLQNNGEIVPPMAFIPAAERYNLMPEIDRWVIANACRELAVDLDRHPGTIFTINLSGTSLSDSKLADYIRDQAAKHGIPPQRLCFEITETAAIANLETAAELMQSLHADGFSFALDDFGSGMSSLSYLKNLPVELLKIDGAFVRNMLGEPLDLAMVQSFIAIGSAVGISTCAEFVENEAILQRLIDMEMNYAQGYAVAMPRPLTTHLRQTERATQIDTT